MFDVDRLLHILEDVKKDHNVRIIFSPRPTLPSRTSLKKAGENRFTLEYNSDLCGTDDVAHEIYRAVQSCDKTWVSITPMPVNPRDTDVKAIAEKLRTLLFDFWIKEQVRKKGFQYGGYLKDYFESLYEQLRAGERLHSCSEEGRNLICSALDYTLYLLNRSSLSQAFREGFEREYGKNSLAAVKKAEIMERIVLENRCETPPEVEKTLTTLRTLLGLGRDITFQKSKRKPPEDTEPLRRM